MRYYADFSDFEMSSDEPLVIHRHGESPGIALIILVHGHGGNRYGAWFPKGLHPSKAGFPKFLYEDIAGLDIGLYAYRTFLARIKFWKSIELEDEAKVLADRVRQCVTSYRRIVLGGHSEGGILVLLTICELINRNDRDTLAAIKALMLFTTPQAGVGLFWPFSRLTKDSRVLRRNSPQLRNIQALFTERVVADAAQANANQFIIPTYAVTAAEDVLVDPFSSTLHIPRERILNVRGSHTTAVKPRTKADDTYVWVLQKLRDIVDVTKDDRIRPDPNTFHPPFSPFTDSHAARTLVPSNLPRLQPFFGRTKELKRIKDALDTSSSTWGLHIDGPGGMGKTSLAVRAANDCPPGQFQRFIFLSVKDREMNDDGEQKRTGLILRGVLEIFNELARELGHPDIEKSSEDQRIRLLLEALHAAQTLIIFDNLESLTKEDLDQLFTFVKNLPEGCKAILTSRPRIGSDSELLFLEPLDLDASLAIIAELAEHNPLLDRATHEERVDLCTRTGGNPLLLRWIAGQLGRGSCRELSEAVQFLCSCPPNNDPLEFIFGDLAREFTEQETIILCMLTHFGLPARINHIEEVTGLPQEATKSALRSLANRPIVVPDQEETTYTLVPMAAEFLRKIRNEVVAQAGSQLQRHTYALIQENGGEKYECFPVLTAAWPIVAASLPLFINGPNAQLQTVCRGLYAFLNFTGRWDELLSLNSRAESKALKDTDEHDAGWRAYHAGLVHHRRGEADLVLQCGARAAAHWEDALFTSSGPGLAAHLCGLGYRLQGNYTSAAASFHQALTHIRSISAESRDEAIILADLADVERNSGDPIAAERGLREAMRIIGTRDGQVTAGCMIRLGRLLLDKFDWQSAETLAREALSLSEGIGRDEYIADSCHNLAKSLVPQKRSPEASPYARRAVDIYDRLHSPRAESARDTLRECDE